MRTLQQRTPLAELPWLNNFLVARGFERTSPGNFSNGRATLRFDGWVLHAVPDDRTKTWRSDLSEATPESIRQLLVPLLASPSFLSHAELEQRRGREVILRENLASIAEIIAAAPETPTGRQLRGFLWSMYNSHHLINLYSAKDDLEGKHLKRMLDVLGGWLDGHISEDALRAALSASGEMDRWDTVNLTGTEETRLLSVINDVETLIKSVSPSQAHVDFAAARRNLVMALDTLKRARKGTQ